MFSVFILVVLQIACNHSESPRNELINPNFLVCICNANIGFHRQMNVVLFHFVPMRRSCGKLIRLWHKYYHGEIKTEIAKHRRFRHLFYVVRAIEYTSRLVVFNLALSFGGKVNFVHLNYSAITSFAMIRGEICVLRCVLSSN